MIRTMVTATFLTSWLTGHPTVCKAQQPELTLNQILDNPALLKEHRLEIIDLYAQLKTDNVEGRYATMLSEHRKRSKRVTETHKALVADWSDVARRIGLPNAAASLEAASVIFIAEAENAEVATYNRNMAQINAAAEELRKILSLLYERAKVRADIVKPIETRLNGESEAFERASAEYVGFWMNEFKEVGNNHQVMGMIRDAVHRAAADGLQGLRDQREMLETSFEQHQTEYKTLITEWAKNIGSGTIPARLKELRLQMEKTSEQLSVVSAELSRKQGPQNADQVLKDFGIKNP